MIQAFDQLWEQAKPAFRQQRTWKRARTLALASLVGFGRKTVTGMLTASGQQFQDWTAAYRLFSVERFGLEALFAPARHAVIGKLSQVEPLVASMDDTLLHKRGKKVSGAAWRRDPMGPKFSTNFIWGQRFLQLSAALPEGTGSSRARAIPLDLVHCPSPRKPSRKAPETEWKAYRQEANAKRISVIGANRIATLRKAMDDDNQQDRSLIVSFDGGYTNRTVFKSVPDRTTLIGRVRKDAKLYQSPDLHPPEGPGRKRSYGKPLPTPEEIRQDPAVPWQTVQAFAAGRVFDFDIKTMAPIRWRGAGARDLRLIIIRPLAYRLSKNSRTLYRDPAYLLCTDPDLDLTKALQAYLWRWEIEVNFRDQKTLLGTGQAQVRTATSVALVPALITAAYSFLHLALTDPLNQKLALPYSQWRKKKPNKRCSTGQAINLMRTQLWGMALGVTNSSDFEKSILEHTKSEKFPNSPASAVFSALA